MATLGGFIAGGSGGVGSIRWGGLRDFGNILGLKVITCEAEPRVLELTGTDILKVAHAYGTNGIIVEAEMPLAAAYDWVDFMAGFDSIIEACAFAERWRGRMASCSRRSRRSRRPCPTTVSTATGPISGTATSRWCCMMAAPVAVPALHGLHRPSTRRDLYPRRHAGRGRARRSCRRSTSSPGTTRRCAALKLDPAITYLQTQYPDLAHVKWAIDTVRRRDADAHRDDPLRRQDRVLRPADRALHQRGAARGDHRAARGQWLPRLQPAPLHAGGRRHEEDRPRAARVQAAGRSQGHAQPRQDDRLGRSRISTSTAAAPGCSRASRRSEPPDAGDGAARPSGRDKLQPRRCTTPFWRRCGRAATRSIRSISMPRASIR